MRIFPKLFLIALLLLPATAKAEQARRDLKGGMSYTAIAAPNVPERPNMPIVPRPGAEEEKPEDTPASRVWQKYKNLAAGTPEKDEDTIEEATPAAGNVKEPKQAKVNAAPPPTGFSALLQQYQDNKKRQSQMRTITVKEGEEQK